MPTGTLNLGAPGFHGKLPARGDFVMRRLGGDFLNAWDGWLQHELAHSRESLGERWLDYYLVGPLWRFALAPGLCEARAYAGVIMPSVDRVGRYFPLTVAVPLAPGADLFALAAPVAGAGAWFDAAEALLLNALQDDDLDLDDFDRAVAALGPLPARGGRGPGPDPAGEATATLHAGRYAPPGQVRAGARGGPGLDAWHLPASGLDDPRGAHLAGAVLDQVLGHYSLWWTSGSECVQSCFNVCASLPCAERFAALFVGGWHGRGWRELPADTPVSDAEGG